MNDKAKFLEQLNGLVKLAQNQGGRITIEEVKAYFSENALTEEQMELVFDYLLSQKMAVQGYIKMTSEEPQEEYTEEEKLYLKEYEADIQSICPANSGEKESLFGQVIAGKEAAKNRLVELYLAQVVKIAKELRQPEVFIGDLIQEGNLGVVLGVEMLTDVDSADEMINTQIRQSMQLLLEEQTELASKDKKMVEKVQALDESITTLTEELGRKVTIDELALYMGLEIEEIEDILKLTGEEQEETEDANKK